VGRKSVVVPADGLRSSRARTRTAHPPFDDDVRARWLTIPGRPQNAGWSSGMRSAAIQGGQRRDARRDRCATRAGLRRRPLPRRRTGLYILRSLHILRHVQHTGPGLPSCAHRIISTMMPVHVLVQSTSLLVIAFTTSKIIYPGTPLLLNPVSPTSVSLRACPLMTAPGRYPSTPPGRASPALVAPGPLGQATPKPCCCAYPTAASLRPARWSSTRVQPRQRRASTRNIAATAGDEEQVSTWRFTLGRYSQRLS